MREVERRRRGRWSNRTRAVPQCLIMDSSLSENRETRGSPCLWLYGVLSLYAAVFLVYAET